MVKQIFILLIIAIILMMSGCLPKITQEKEFQCPPKEQDCSALPWTGTPVDTSKVYRDTAKTYYKFESVKQVNSPDDEWVLSFITERKAELTYTDINQNRSVIVRMIRDNEGSPESGIGTQLEGHFGAFSVRNNKLAFAATNEDGFFTLGNSDIYYGSIQNNIVFDQVKLSDSLDPEGVYWDSQPALAPDSSVIFFASDRPSFGGTDLWFTVRNSNGKWSAPINCGELINSKCDELTPFISYDGKRLFFASGGHENIGGYDIFVSNISDIFWKAIKKRDFAELKTGKTFFSSPENLKPPLNTPFDELFPTSPMDDENLLYYSSNQASKNENLVLLSGGFDIYLRSKVTKFEIAKHKEKEIKTQDLTFDDKSVNIPTTETPEIPFWNMPVYILEGVIFNARTNMSVPYAEVSIRELPNSVHPVKFSTKIMKDTLHYKVVELEKDKEFEITTQSREVMGDKFKLRKVGNDTVIVINSDSTGKYRVELEKDREFEVTAQAPDLFFDSYKLRVEKSDTNSHVSKIFHIPEQLTLRINFPTNVFNNPYRYVLDSNGVESNRTWQEEIDLLAENLKLSSGKFQKIILVGHTDEVGTEEYNNKLGQNRVNFVVNELIKRGVPAEVLEASSAGELQPLQRRSNESLEVYRKRLRRVELQKII
jgi:outer membrane protein OmpA-like peptidoglycan-associated protein